MKQTLRRALFLATFVALPAHAADPLSRLLAEGPWCAEGTRVEFKPDGRYQVGERESEKDSHGAWEVRRGLLRMGEEGSDMDVVPLEVKRTRGRFVLLMDGDEYIRCQ